MSLITQDIAYKYIWLHMHKRRETAQYSNLINEMPVDN